MQLSYISFIFLSLQTYYAKTLSLEEFKQVSKRTTERYLGHVEATKTTCDEHLSINPQGNMTCYAIKAGNQPLDMGIFTDDLVPYNKSTKKDFVLHLSTNKALTGDMLKEKSPDFVLFTSEINPECEIIEFAHQRLGPIISSGATFTIREYNTEKSTTTHESKPSFKYETPKFLPVFLSTQAKAKYTTSTEEVTHSNIGKTFESQRDSSCTPYAISYALSCKYTNHRKVLFQEGKVIGNYSVTQPLKGDHFIPNPYDNAFVSQVTGCVHLGSS
ncbi:hypothetical protein DSO57_1009578 [Entomophthora muscae]|uniref:Uncharacterized protein n=1 Tax=Entomophthora muscae TaxID=34485 RepID=A0ACC2TU11_9FUNG|nr:hypothetical protein DSO57_1009578 [Entomophthora muscae]